MKDFRVFYIKEEYFYGEWTNRHTEHSTGRHGGERSGHFGHCDVFTFVDVECGEIKEVTTVPNQSHVQGGCMVPVNLLASHKVKALIVGGIGMRPLMGFRQVGIDVYYDATQPQIAPVVEDLVTEKLPLIGEEQVCGGGAQNLLRTRGLSSLNKNQARRTGVSRSEQTQPRAL